MAKSQWFELIVDQIHPHVARHQVVVGVTGLDDGLAQVHHAVPALFVVPEAVVAEHEIARIGKHLLGTAFATLQSNQAHERFVRGPRGIRAAQGAIEQRFIGGLIQCLPVVGIDPFNEQIRIKRRLADKGQHLAGARVQSHHGATACSKQFLDQLLQHDVNRQHHGFTRGRWFGSQSAHRAPPGRGLHFVKAGQAVQIRFVALLYPEFADVVGAVVVAVFIFFREFLFFAGIDAPDVAHHVTGCLPIGILSKQSRFDVYPGETVALRGKSRQLLRGQSVADRDRLEAARLLAQLLETPSIPGLDVDDGGQLVDDFFGRGLQTRRGDLDRVGRIIGRQHHAVAVRDHPAVGDDGHHRGAVALCLMHVFIMTNDLQIKESNREQHKARGHKGRGDEDTATKAMQVRMQGVTAQDHGARVRLKGAILIGIGGPTLRNQQDEGNRRPQSCFQQRRENNAPMRQTASEQVA